MPDSFRCTLVTPKQQVFDEQVSYVSIPSWDGQVGLMSKRAPLVTKLGQGVLRLASPQGGTQRFYVGGGFAQMKRGTLSLVAEEAVPEDQVQHTDAKAALAEAQAFKPRTEEDFTKNQRDLTRARAMLALSDTRGDA